MGINNGTPSGGATVCGQIFIHNDQWFGFVAGTTSITIDILTSNCANGDGLQAAFFENCQDDAITCNGGTGGGAGIPLTLSYSNFVPGQTYFLMIDGYIGDVCNYEIDVTDGSVTPPAPSAPPAPQGPTMVCPGTSVVYTIPDIDGAGYYRWTSPAGSQINGGGNNVAFSAPDGTSVTITFGNAGGQVCVQAGNACFPPQQSCISVINQPIPPTQLAPVTICYEDLPFTWEEEPFTTISTPGNYTLTSVPYVSYLGCDSTVKQTITVKNRITKNIGPQYVCPGACFTINGTSYCQSGSFSEIFQSYQDCDSIVQFSILNVPIVANIPPVSGLISCTNPSLVLNSTGSTTSATATYTWTNSSGAIIGNQVTQTVTAGGIYNLIVSNSIGQTTCYDTTFVNVPQNIVLPNASAQGDTLTCFPGGNSVTLQGGSTTAGVNFLWTGPGITPANQNASNPTVTDAGSYLLTVTNPANNCTATATAIVIANNTVPTATITGGQITCVQQSVILNSSTNAPTPAYLWSGPGINAGNQAMEDPLVNIAGDYTVTITNTANNCSSTATTTILADTAIPTASAGSDLTINCLQQSVVLGGGGSPANVTFNWTGPGITPPTQTQATPTVNQAGQYILTVTNPQNGCQKADTAQVGASLTPPTVDAGADQTITCTVTSVTLGGAGTSQGANFQVLWTGPGINAGNQAQSTPVVSQAGPYTLLVTNTTNGCTATDNTTIDINTTLPTANAGQNQTLTCSTPNGVTLNGSAAPAGVEYLWAGPGIGANNQSLQTPQVTQAGLYTLQITNPVNGCTQTDDVQVLQDANVPVANAGSDLELNCATTFVDINASGSTSGVNIIYQWTGPAITPLNANVQNPAAINLPGAYNLMVIDTSNNCENTDVLIVTIDTLAPVASAGADLVLNCLNNGANTLDASASSSGVNFSVLWTGPGINIGNQNSVQALVNQPGLYNLVVTNTQNNCTATDVAQVAADLANPTADAGADQIIDCVATSTAIGGASSSGANFTYTWTGPGINAGNQNAAQATVGLAGNYSLTVTNTTNGCTSTDDMVLTLNAVYPSATAGQDLTLTCAQPAQSLNGTGSSAGANFQTVWTGPGINAGNQGTLSPSISQPGLYILSITDISNSCNSQDTVEVLLNQVIPAASAGSPQDLDCQTTVVTLDGTGSASGAGIVYVWTGPGINTGNQNSQSPDVNLPGAYTLLVTDNGNGCTNTAAVQITQDIAAPTANAGQTFTLTCAQTALPIDGSGSSSGANYAYLWQGPGINTSNFSVQNPIVADSGTYVLTVTNLQNFCTASAQVYIALDQDLPSVNSGPDQILTCQNDTLALDGSGSQAGNNIAYTWSGPGIVPGTQSGITPQVFLLGNYTLTLSNTLNGCTNTDITTVNQDIIPPIADAGSDQTLTCTTAGGVTISAAASDTGPGFSLFWNGPDIDAANQNLVAPVVAVAGVYTVLITNASNGCTSTASVTVGVDQNLPLADAGLDQTISCAIGQVTLDAGGSTANGPLQYLWSGPGIHAGNATQISPAVNQSGVYTVVVTNSLTGCTASDNADVLLDTNPPQVSASGGIITCTNPVVSLASTSSLSGSTFLWTGPDINLGNMILQNPQVGEPGTYTIVVTAPNGCSASATATVGIDSDVPLGSAEGTQLNCTNNGQSTISGTVSTPGATFAWTGPNGFTSSQLNPTVTVPGIYIFTLTSVNGCKKPYNAEVTEDFAQPMVMATVNDKLDCSTTSLKINGNGTSVGPIFTYAWTTTNGNIVSGANTLTPTVDAPGVYTLLVSNTLNGCTNTRSVSVEYDPAVPTGFNLTVQNIRCFGELNGFIAINSVVGGTQPFQFSLNGGPASGTAQFSKLGEGAYTIALLDANGCALDTTVNITAPGALQVDLEDDILVELGTPVTVIATITGTTPVASITWNPTPPCAANGCLTYDTLPTHSYLQTITVRDANGCISADRQIIQVDRTRRIYVPNVFNPDSNDPLNAFLMVQAGNDVRIIKTWQVFDRWGNAIYSQNDFQPNDPTYAWDGKARGDDAASAVYVWYIEVEFIDGEVEEFKGDVALIRK
ncbi:MAG: gliding motility-associated C-terminal domain-containing protein [Saprospirales bacterium]|nr:gliding motility-associated C-terminal domain-containing protein [Saprospirales bacterium]